MVEQRLFGNGEDNVLQFFQIPYPGNLFHRVRVAEDKIAKTEVRGNGFPQVDIHFLGILVDKAGAIAVSKLLIPHFGRLHNKRHIFIARTNGFQQTDSGFGVFLSIPREVGIGNDT